MKYFFFLLIFTFFYVMNPESGAVLFQKPERSDIAEQTRDTIQITDHKYFEITFYETGFNRWLEKQEPMTHFYESSLEIKNMQYATEWNRRVANPSTYDPKLYNQRIEYKINPKRRYGLEVNYKLYQYFIFFEQKHEQLLLD